MAISRQRRKQLVAAGSVRSVAKRRASTRRFHLAMLRGLCNYLRTHPDALTAPHVQPGLDELTELLVMRKITQLGLAPQEIRS